MHTLDFKVESLISHLRFCGVAQQDLHFQQKAIRRPAIHGLRAAAHPAMERVPALGRCRIQEGVLLHQGLDDF